MRRVFAPAFLRRRLGNAGPAVPALRHHGGEPTGDRTKPLKVKVVQAAGGGRTHEVTAYAGQSLLDVFREHDIQVEGACDGSCACSTCHVYLDDDSFARLEIGRASCRERVFEAV